MAGRSSDDGRGPWSNSGSSFYSNISSSSGTISTAYTSRDSRLSSASTGPAMPMHMRFSMGFYIEKTDEQQIKHVRSLVQEFFGTGTPSVNCCINGGDMSVVERWLTELGVGWLPHLSVGPSARILKLEKWIWPWIRALDEITETLRLMAPLYHHDGPVGLPSNCEEEPETERTEASIPDEFQLLFAQFIQKIMLKMLAFIDVILAPNASTTREVCVSNLSILLCVHGAVSKALSAIQLLFHSPQIGKIQGEMLSLLSAKEGEVSEAIWTTMEQIRTHVLESMEDIGDSSCFLAPQASTGIHKATRSVMGYISFLQSRYSSVPLIVSEAARLGKYVPQIEQVPPLASMIIEMAACLEEKLANMSESFVDKGLRFLFLLNNSYFIQEEIKYSFYLLEFPMPALPCKVEGYMKSYLQVSWAPVLSCLLGPTPMCLGRNYSPFSKFEFEFHKVYTAQKQWKMPNPELRETLRKAITQKLVPGYTEYIEGNKVTTPKLSPEELEEMLQELFEG